MWRWERELDEDAVDCRIGIQLVDKRHKLVLARRSRELVLETLHSRLARRLGLRADVSGARWMFADQNDGEARRPSLLGRKLRGNARDAITKARGKRLSVDQPRGHGPRNIA